VRLAARIALVLIVAVLPAAAYAACHVRANLHVALMGTTDDPDVLVWDSRFRLRDYEGGTFDRMRALLPHAMLVRAGTRASVLSCVSGFVPSKYESVPQDAVGILITSGPRRGGRGWVLGSAIRTLSRTQTRVGRLEYRPVRR
jgi:hypothetical protein